MIGFFVALAGVPVVDRTSDPDVGWRTPGAHDSHGDGR
jgi:hypothetical protein